MDIHAVDVLVIAAIVLLVLLGVTVIGRARPAAAANRAPVPARAKSGPPGVRFTAPPTPVWWVAQPTAAPSLDDILALTPIQFEGLSRALMENLGYFDVRRTGGPGDLNADITCRDGSGQVVIVQCKRYKTGQAVGAPVVQTFIGMMAVHHRAASGFIITTGRFTRPAIALARRHRITLIDGTDLPGLLRQTRTPVNRASLAA